MWRSVATHPMTILVSAVLATIGLTYGFIEWLDSRVKSETNDKLLTVVPGMISDALSKKVAVQELLDAEVDAKKKIIELDVQIKQYQQKNKEIDDKYNLLNTSISQVNDLLKKADTSSSGKSASVSSDKNVSFVDLPDGAIVSFDKITGCPTGWIVFEPAVGRFLIGAGSSTTNQDKDGLPLSIFQPGQTGGQGQHRLSVAELPPHAFELSVFQSPENTMGGGYGFDRFVGEPARAAVGKATGTLRQEKTSTLGEGKPLAMLPPYYAVTYCRKG